MFHSSLEFKQRSTQAHSPSGSDLSQKPNSKAALRCYFVYQCQLVEPNADGTAFDGGHQRLHVPFPSSKANTIKRLGDLDPFMQLQ